MANPWLSVPLDDYKAHMNAPGIGQLDALADLLAVAVSSFRPASVAMLGIAGGNGLDRIDSRITTRIVGLDVNPSYLDAVRRRYAGMPGLQLHCVDLAHETVDLEPVQLVHAALVFEHTGTGRCLENALSLVSGMVLCRLYCRRPAKGRRSAQAHFSRCRLSSLTFPWLIRNGSQRRWPPVDSNCGSNTIALCREARPSGWAYSHGRV